MSQLFDGGFAAFTDGSSWGTGKKAYTVGCFTRYKGYGGALLTIGKSGSTSLANDRNYLFTLGNGQTTQGFIRVN